MLAYIYGQTYKLHMSTYRLTSVNQTVTVTHPRVNRVSLIRTYSKPMLPIDGHLAYQVLVPQPLPAHIPRNVLHLRCRVGRPVIVAACKLIHVAV